MVTIGMSYYVRPGRGQVFEDACKKVVETMQGIDGHDESHLYREVTDGEAAYLIVSRWQSEDAFSAFVASGRKRSLVPPRSISSGST